MEQDDIGEVEITATYDQYESFLASAVWHDIKTEIGCWIEVIRGSLGSNDEPRELFRMQGRLEACSNALELPANLLAVLEDRFKTQNVEDSDATMGSSTQQEMLDSLL